MGRQKLQNGQKFGTGSDYEKIKKNVLSLDHALTSVKKWLRSVE